MANRRSFTDYERKTVYANGNGKCGICGKSIEFADMTIDHKIPLSRGGTNDFRNLQPACHTCNLMKNMLTMPELLDRISDIMKHNRQYRIMKIWNKSAG